MNPNRTNAADASRAILLDLLANSLGRHRREIKEGRPSRHSPAAGPRGRAVAGEPEPSR